MSHLLHPSYATDHHTISLLSTNIVSNPDNIRKRDQKENTYHLTVGYVTVTSTINPHSSTHPDILHHATFQTHTHTRLGNTKSTVLIRKSLNLH